MRSIRGFVLLVVFAAGCAKNPMGYPNTNAPQPGWTQDVVQAEISNCERYIAANLNDPNNALPICQCWISKWQYASTPQNFYNGNPTVDNLLPACSLPYGENPAVN